MTAKERISIEPFFKVYEARRKDESKNNYFVEFYNLAHLNNEII